MGNVSRWFGRGYGKSGLPWWLSGKESSFHAGDTGDSGVIPGSGISAVGGNGNPHQYSCCKYSIDRGAWRAAVQRVAKSQTLLSTHCTEKKEPWALSSASWSLDGGVRPKLFQENGRMCIRQIDMQLQNISESEFEQGWATFIFWSSWHIKRLKQDMLKETSLKYQLLNLFFKIFIEFVTILFLLYIYIYIFFFFLAAKSVGSYLPDQGSNFLTLCIGGQNLNHWTAREVPKG